MIKPNFFILGAPKCGTTSLAAWLAEHPRIYMSLTKEPHYFNTDHKRFVNSLEGYERLFAGATQDHLAVGEASVWYLYSSAAVPNILAYNPGAKFIVMLRNPIDMAPSLHEELVFTGREDVADFARAWELQKPRRHGEHLPRMVVEPTLVQYRDLCSLGAQVERLVGLVPRERIKLILMEDIAKDPATVYRDVLRFLGVPDDGRSDFAAHNQAKTRRWPGLLVVAWLMTNLKRLLGIESGLGLWTRIDAMNRLERPRAAVSPQTQQMLRNAFAADITLLQSLIGRDLSHWLA